MDISGIGIFYLLIWVVCVLYCAGRVLIRAGFSPLWSPLVLVPVVDIVLVWVFAYSVWPGFPAPGDPKLPLIRRRVILVLSVVITLLLTVFAVGAYFVIPSFSSLFDSFQVNLPWITALILNSYQYWVVIPFLAMILCVDMLIRKEWSAKYQRAMLAVLLSFLTVALAMMVVVVWAMYAPIFQMGGLE